MATVGPVIEQLPTAPNRGMSSAQYPIIADAWAAKIGPWTTQVNATTVWMGQAVDLTYSARDAAAANALAASQSAETASSAVGAAQAARNAAAASANSAAISAAAAGAAAGAPSLAGNKGKVMTVRADETGFELKFSGQQIGDILYTALPVGPEYKLADGAVYLQSSYPDWISKVGAIPVSSPTTLTASPTTLPVSPALVACKWGASGSYLVIGGNSNASGYDPVIHVYKKTNGVLEKLANVPTLAPQNATTNLIGLALSADAVYLMATYAAAPFLEFFKRTGDVFVKLANPATMPTNMKSISKNAVCSDDGVYWVFIPTGQSFYTVYKRTGDVFTFLTTNQPANNGSINALTMSGDGVNLVLAQSGGANQHTFVKRAGDTFAGVTALVTNPPFFASALSISGDGNYLFFSETPNSNYRWVFYKRGSDGMYTAMPTVAAEPNGYLLGYCEFNYDGKYLAYSVGSSLNVSLMMQRSDTNTTYTPLANFQGSVAGAGVPAFSNGQTIFNNYLAIVKSGTPYLTLYRDGYAFNPLTEFQVPMVTTAANGVTAANTATNSKPPQVAAYVKMKEPA